MGKAATKKYDRLPVFRACFLSVWCICLVFYASTISAKHLVGGSITYKFVNAKNGYYHYQITLDAYRDCSDLTAPSLDPVITIGIYNHTTTGQKSLFDTVSIKLSSLQSIDAVSGGSNCSFHPKTCLEHGKYVGDINLPASNYGYDLIYLRCCRNVMVNLPQNSGYDYYAFISPTKYQNTSPSFNDVPVPYICVNDTVTLNFSATEPDGDSITYKIAWPYSGATTGNPAALPPSYFSEPDHVSYNFGYSYLEPFGSQGVCKIGKTNGLLTVYAVKSGNYAIAVDYFEYRNGVLIDSTRRDVQFIVLPCPSNPAPVRKPIGGSTATDYFVQAGQATSFDFAFSDPNLDRVTLTASGPIFSKKPNTAVLTLQKQTDSFAITANVKWTTLCTDASPRPYSFIVKVQDNGCPPKITYQTLNIYVSPPASPAGISGPSSACGLGDTFTYSAVPPPNTILFWKITGGKIYSPTNSNSIKVQWNGNAIQGILKVVAINPQGCPSDTISMVVKIFPKPPIPVLTGPNQVCINNVVAYSITATGYKSFIWTYGNGVLVTDSGPKVFLKWINKGAAYVKAIAIDANGCHSDTLLIHVNINIPEADSIYGPRSVCPNSRNIDYMVNSQTGAVFYWAISGGSITSGSGTSHIRVNWGNLGIGTLKTVEKTIAGCIGDTVTLKINIEYQLHSPPIQGDSEVCEFTKNKAYKVVKSTNSTYQWSVVGGAIQSGQGTSQINIDWGHAGTGIITLQQTAYDSVNHQACIAAPETYLVNIDSLPNTPPINSKDSACAETTLPFLVHGFYGSHYIWSGRDTGLKILNQGADSISVYFSKPGLFTISVQEISRHGCPGNLISKTVFIDSLPGNNPVMGTGTVCAPDFKGWSYQVKGGSRSTYNWMVNGGNIVSGNGTNHIVVDWAKAGSWTVKVIETSLLGCKGPEKSCPVKVDSLVLNLDLVTTARTNDNVIEINWHAINAEFLKDNVGIYRSVSPAHDGYRLIASVPSSSLMYTDKNVSTHSLAYYYKLGVKNSCGKMLWSSVHRSILLEDKWLNDSSLGLYWNRYTGWTDGVDLYKVFKITNDDTDMRYYGYTSDSTYRSYIDPGSYHLCYRIGAVSNGAAPMISWSNNICVDPDPVLWIPNAFTPNDDPENNTWRVVATNYKSFRADIYNRWGEHVFTTDNPNRQWDGHFNGAACPEGVYLYMVQVGGSKKNIYKNGTLNLLR